MTWQRIIATAASQRFAKTGSVEPFRLARRDLLALCEELCGAKLNPEANEAFVQIQARVYVPDLKIQVFVDEWTKETPDGPKPG